MTEIGFANPGVGVIGCGLEVMDVPQKGDWPEGVSIMPGREAARRIFMGEGEVIGPHLMMRADLLKLRKPFYRTDYNANDAEACFMMLQHSDWANTSEILGWTRVHDDSATHNFMHRIGLHFMDWVRFLNDYGSWAMSPEDLEEQRRIYQRYYLRRLMLWGLQKDGADKLRKHISFLREHGETPSAFDFIDAIGDLALKRLKLRLPVRSGHPLG
jgi:hypothetical protein